MQPDLPASEVSAFLARLSPPLTTEHKIIVAVSGGVDSLSLLHILLQGAVTPAQLVVAHFDHGWTAEAADTARQVAAIAAKWGVRSALGRADTPALAAQARLSLEEASRQARYAFLQETAVAHQATYVATGHNGDDQAETVLMHLLRGTGLAGLGGMTAISPLPGAAAPPWLIRPLLNVPRAAITAYSEKHHLQPIPDSTNADTRFFRNWLRLEALPLLAKRRPRVREHLRRTAAIVAADDALLNQLTGEAWAAILKEGDPAPFQLTRAAWQALPLALRRRTLRHGWRQVRPDGRDIGWLTLEQARLVAETGGQGAAASLPDGVVLRVVGDALWLGEGGQVSGDFGPQLSKVHTFSGAALETLNLGAGWQLTALRMSRPPPDLVIDRWQAFVAVPRGMSFVARGRQPGERLQPLGLNGRSRALRKVMNDVKIPAALRDRWPVVATNKHPLWVVGGPIDERARVSDDSDQIFHLYCHYER